VLNCKHVKNASCSTSDLHDSTSCSNCSILELKLHDANARVSQIANDMITHEVLSCSNCRKQKKPMSVACDKCPALSK
jgi:hypothetical protein